MIWEVEKNNKKSYLVGTAHFFPYSFRSSLSRYIKDASNLLFEGPLDEENMARVMDAGRAKDSAAHLFDELDRQTIEGINRTFVSPYRNRYPLDLFNLGTSSPESTIYTPVKGMRSWMAFLTIWTAFLEKNG